jgi:hypothetical protein
MVLFITTAVRTSNPTEDVAVTSQINENKLRENHETKVSQNKTTVTEASDFQNGASLKIRGIRRRRSSAQKTGVFSFSFCL